MEKEWHIPEAAAGLEQGDILLSRDPRTGALVGLVLVITADCDLCHGKFGSHLGCLRIMTLHEYLRVVWAGKKLQRLIETETGKVALVLNKWNSVRLPGANSLSFERIQDWVRRSEPEAICEDLAIPPSDSAKVMALVAAFRAGLFVLDAKASSDNFQRLVEFRSAMLAKTLDECLDDTLRQAQNDPLPTDAFLLPELPQLNLGSAVVLLRELSAVRIDAVCFRTIDATSAEMWLRIGRLEPTFKYAISQAFGFLYSRIGLPEFYESRCKAVTASIPSLNWN